MDSHDPGCFRELLFGPICRWYSRMALLWSVWPCLRFRCNPSASLHQSTALSTATIVLDARIPGATRHYFLCSFQWYMSQDQVAYLVPSATHANVRRLALSSRSTVSVAFVPSTPPPACPLSIKLSSTKPLEPVQRSPLFPFFRFCVSFALL